MITTRLYPTMPLSSSGGADCASKMLTSLLMNAFGVDGVEIGVREIQRPGRNDSITAR